MTRPSPAGYSGTPLVRKLGIKPGALVVIKSAPPSFETALGVLPEGARLTTRANPARTMTIWFVRRARDLQRGAGRVVDQMGDGGLWICWPKKSGTISSDLDGGTVRRAGLDHGVVDHKICAVDADWSGLRFARRRQ